MRTRSSDRQTPEGFDALVRELLKLPQNGSKEELLAALKDHGEFTLEWYQNRINAITEAGTKPHPRAKPLPPRTVN